MKRTHVHRMVAVVLGLVVVALVALGPATSSVPPYGQVMAQEETPVPLLPEETLQPLLPVPDGSRGLLHKFLG